MEYQIYWVPTCSYTGPPSGKDGESRGTTQCIPRCNEESIPFNFLIRNFLECLGIPSAWTAPPPISWGLPHVMGLGAAMPYFGISGALHLRFSPGIPRHFSLSESTTPPGYLLFFCGKGGGWVSKTHSLLPPHVDFFYVCFITEYYYWLLVLYSRDLKCYWSWSGSRVRGLGLGEFFNL